MATSPGQRPRNFVGSGIHHEVGGGNRLFPSATFGAHFIFQTGSGGFTTG